MVSRIAVSFSVVSIASLLALWSACKSDPETKLPPGAMAPDAPPLHDAHAFLDAPAPRSCTNHPNPVMMGSGSDETETLFVTFDCGSYMAGSATPTMKDGSGAKTVLPSQAFTCGNNKMMFNTQVTMTVYELIAPDFDILCN